MHLDSDFNTSVPAPAAALNGTRAVWRHSRGVGRPATQRTHGPTPTATCIIAGILPFLTAACPTATAQTQVDLATQAKHVDFSGATSTKPFKAGTTLPSLCAVGDMFFKIDAPAGLNVYGCSQINTWTVESSAASGAGSLTVASNGVTVGTRSLADIIAGAGLATLVTDTGSQINIQLAMDTALIQTQFGEQAGTALRCAPQSGSSTTYSCAMNPTLPTYSVGMLLHWIPDVNTVGGPTTLNVDTLGAKPVKLDDGVTDPSLGTALAGKMYLLWFDGSVFRIISTTSGGGGGGGGGSFVVDPGANGIPYRTGLGTATLATATTVSGLFACVDAGSVNAYACNLSPAIASYTSGAAYWFKAGSTNTGPSTINFNSLGAVTLKKQYSQDLAANDIRAGQWVMIVYDGTNMQMMSQTGGSAPGGSPVRSKELFLGGYNNFGNGWSPGGDALQTEGGISGSMVNLGFNHTNSANTWQFRWDANWDNSQPVSLLITAADAGGNGGTFKLDWSIACVAPGTNVYATPTFGNVTSTGSLTFTGTTTKELSLSNLDFSSSGCAPNMLTVVRAARDNSITGNSADDISLYSATLTYSVK